MRLSGWIIVTALLGAAPYSATAQTTGGQTTTTDQTGSATEPAQGTATATPQTTSGTGFMDRVPSHWLASIGAGTNFAQDVDDPRFDFGGGVGYLWHGVVGGEFMANFSPEFHVEGGRSLLIEDEPWVNTYMFNVMGAFPMGANASWAPYVSGGFGAMSLRSESLASEGDEDISG